MDAYSKGVFGKNLVPIVPMVAHDITEVHNIKLDQSKYPPLPMLMLVLLVINPLQCVDRVARRK